MALNNSNNPINGQSVQTNPLDRPGQMWKQMGRALFSIQALEFCLSHYVALLLHKRRDEAISLLDKSLRKTLGQLIKTLKDNAVPIPDGYETRLDVFVEERNWLVHRLYRENSEHIFSDVKHEIVIKRISALIEEAKSISQTIVELSEQWCYKQGMTKEQYDAEIKKGLSKIEYS